jgi:integrase
LLATAFDLKVFFSMIDKEPGDVVTTDVLAFIKAQREPRLGATVVRIEDGEGGLAARTIKRRLATIAGLYEYLIIRGDTAVSQNPVPRGLAMRRPGQWAVRGVPLIRAPRALPRVIDRDEVDMFIAALRTARDRAMVEAMLLGGLRRCEVLGLRLGDVRPGERRLFIATRRVISNVPVSALFASPLKLPRTLARRTAQLHHIFVSAEGTTERTAARRQVGQRSSAPGCLQQPVPDLSPFPYLLHPAARGGDGSGGDPGASWAPLDRVDPYLLAPG